MNRDSYKTASALATVLLKAFAKGEISAERVVEVASAAWQDGWGRSDQLAHDLAHAGKYALRGVVRAARNAGFMGASPHPYRIKVPGPDGTEAWQEIFLPHEIYFKLLERHGFDASHWTLAPEDLAAVTGLGKLLRDWGTHRDVQVDVDELPQTGILGLHCDGATYTSSTRAGSQKGCLVCSINVISASEPRLRGQRHLVFVISKAKVCNCGCSGFHTLQALFRVFSWSMTCLARSTWPTCRHDNAPWSPDDLRQRLLPTGVPLPRAALLQLRGDWEWMYLCFRFRLPRQQLFCWMCNAELSDGVMCYKHLGPLAPHRQTLISHQEYLAACAREAAEVSALFESPGTMLEHTAPDSMHGGDAGVFCDCIGSLFWLHVTNRRWFGSVEQGLRALNNDLNGYYAAHRDRGLTKITPLTKVQIRSKSLGYPYLKVTAAGCRHVADFALALAYQHRDGFRGRAAYAFGQRHRLSGQEAFYLHHLVETMEGMVAYQRAVKAQPFSEGECREGLYRFFDGYQHLHTLWHHGLTERQSALQPWHMRPKMHMMQHIVQDKICLFGSPMHFWCYGDEDFVGVVKRVCQMSKHPWTLEQRVGEKCMIMAGVADYEAIVAALREA